MVKELEFGYGMEVSSLEDVICSQKDMFSTEEKIINTVTSIAAISRGKDKSNNPRKRFIKLLKEAAPNYSFRDLEDLQYHSDNDVSIELNGLPGRPLEYVPVKLEVLNVSIEDITVIISGTDIRIKMNIIDFQNRILKFSRLIDTRTMVTNLRALLSAKNQLLDDLINDLTDERSSELLKSIALSNSNNDDYRVLKIRAPYFVFAQIRTHGQLSQIAVSNRVTDSDIIWLPNDLQDRVIGFGFTNLSGILSDPSLSVKDIVTNNDYREVKTLLKALGYPKEIYSRYPNFMEYKEWIIGGSLSDPYQWGHLLLEREAYPDLHKSWVQKETKRVAGLIKRELLKTI